MADTIEFSELAEYIKGIASRIDVEEFVDKELKTETREYFRERFDEQESPSGVDWKSQAKATKFGGKFAASYKRRPSGREVTAASKRYVDTSATRNSIKAKIEKARNLVTLVIYSATKILDYMVDNKNIVFENSKEMTKKWTDKYVAYLNSKIKG